MGDVLEGTTISSNSAAVGGGVYAADAAAAFFSDSTLVSNIARVRDVVHDIPIRLDIPILLLLHLNKGIPIALVMLDHRSD